MVLTFAEKQHPHRALWDNDRAPGQHFQTVYAAAVRKGSTRCEADIIARAAMLAFASERAALVAS